MEHIYTVHTKLIDNKLYYFIKKILVLTEFRGLADIVVGYGMHTDFVKACNIAGVPNSIIMQQLLLEMEERNHAELHAAKQINITKNSSVKISDSVNRWLAERETVSLN